jgi:hypothetical protein
LIPSLREKRRVIMKTGYELTFGQITFSERTSMPIIEVVLKNDETSKIVGYLSPFRRYSFQVSMTVDGDGDMGSTEVSGGMAMEISAIPNSHMQAMTVKGLINWALVEYTRSSYGHHDSGEEAIWILGSWTSQVVLDKYAALCCEFLTGNPASTFANYSEVCDELKKMGK